VLYVRCSGARKYGQTMQGRKCERNPRLKTFANTKHTPYRQGKVPFCCPPLVRLSPLSVYDQRFLLQLLTLGGASRAWEQSTTLKCPFACHHSVSSLAHTQTVFTSQRQHYFQMVFATQRGNSSTCKQALKRALRGKHRSSTYPHMTRVLMCAAPAFCLAAHSLQKQRLRCDRAVETEKRKLQNLDDL